MKLFVSNNDEDIKDSGGGGFINQSGIYDVQLNYVQLAETKNKAYQLNFNVTNNGMAQTIYGPILVGKDGKINDITKRLLNRLCVIAGMADKQEIETDTVEMPVGKDQKLMEMEIIPELSDIPVKIRVQMEYSLWENNIQERRNVKTFFREDGASAEEAKTSTNIGTQLAKDTEKYATHVTYKDGLTEDDVQTWLKERFAKGSADSAKTATPKATSKRPLFGK
jgi:hypothetical protein